MIRKLGCIMLGLALSGCATRGALTIKCTDLNKYVTDLEDAQLLRTIQSDAGRAMLAQAEMQKSTSEKQLERLREDPITNAMIGLMAPSLKQNGDMKLAVTVGPPNKVRPVLLLSGGGQWGAFGAGFLKQLNQKGGNDATDYGIITGVSTGGVQALFVAVNRPDVYERLRVAYSPKMESEVVNRHSIKAFAILTGSIAGLKPLKNVSKMPCARRAIRRKAAR